MVISTNLFASLLLFSVSVKFELVIQFSLCASRFCMSHFLTLSLHGGGVKGRGRFILNTIRYVYISLGLCKHKHI